MANIRRERLGVTRDELLQVYNGGGLSTSENPLPNPVAQAEEETPTAQPSNTAPVAKEADNSLLIFGGLALFGAIAFSGRRSVAGVSAPSAKWLLPAAGVAALIAFFKFKQPSQAEKLNAIMIWVDQQADSPENKQYFVDKVRSMTAAELSDVYEFLVKYNFQGTAVPPGPLKDRLAAISAKYQIFT